MLVEDYLRGFSYLFTYLFTKTYAVAHYLLTHLHFPKMLYPLNVRQKKGFITARSKFQLFIHQESPL